MDFVGTCRKDSSKDGQINKISISQENGERDKERRIDKGES